MSTTIMDITWKELEEMDLERTIMFISFAPIEEHGLHLPLGVDVFESKHWEKRCIELLEQKYKDYSFLTMPAIPFGCGEIKGFAGNIHLKQSTIKTIAYEIIENIVSWGVRYVVIISGHAEPRHLIAIEEACDEINSKYGMRAISPMGAIFSGEKVGLELEYPLKLKQVFEEYPNDFHAGWIETSNMLDINEDLVRSKYKDQEDVEIEPQSMMDSNKIKNSIAGKGHIGYPKIATKELGGLLNENMSNKLFEAVVDFMINLDKSLYKHHFLYEVPFLKGDGN